MSFYLLKQDRLIEGSAALDGVPNSIDSLDWIQGKPMPDPILGGELVLDLSLASGDYRGSVIDSFLTLYHETLKQGLDAFGIDNVEYFPVTLRDQETDEREYRYFLANIIGLLDCVDMEKSKTKPWASSRGFDFESIVIDKEKTNGASLFRLKEDPTKVIINKELKQYFDETDLLVGVDLVKTEDYSDW